MPELTLYHAAPSRSSIVRWMLEEIREPYDIHLLSLSKGDNRTPAYLAVNPMGKVEARRAALGYGDFDTVMNVVAQAVASGPFILGDQFTAADVVIGSDLRFGMMFKLISERAEFTAYTGRLAQRPALQRAEAKDKE